jgi:branched-chain amino acid transport system permease protein
MIRGSFSGDSSYKWYEFMPFIIAVAAYFLMPDYLSLGARIMIFILFALSLDLILGYGGIATLGHSAFFGVGAYTAGILSSKFGVNDAFVQMIAAIALASLAGLITGAMILRTHGLTLLMLTLAITSVFAEFANHASSLTGGADGLSGVKIAPLLGMFRFDLYGKTAYIYSLIVLFFGWFLVRKLVHSPFGLMLVGIRENGARMGAIGAPVKKRLLIAYTISAGLAGVAGALVAQVNQFVGLNVFGFELSGELLIMLILGGVGRIYGAFVGPAVFLIAQDLLAKQFPEYWYLGIGLMLIIVVLFARDGILGIVDKLLARFKS